MIMSSRDDLLQQRVAMVESQIAARGIRNKAVLDGTGGNTCMTTETFFFIDLNQRV